MAKRKPTNKYYFSVEGETEQWYLKWLQDTINNTEKAACNPSLNAWEAIEKILKDCELIGK